MLGEGRARLGDDVELDVTLDVANDPFFGRGGKFMGKSQREQSLKFELFVPVASREKPRNAARRSSGASGHTAIASATPANPPATAP